VTRRLLAMPELAGLGRVVLYAALPDELPTRALHEALRRLRKPILFPRCRPDDLLEFARVEGWEDLEPGRYGVLEPTGPAQALAHDDLVVVPGVAFDGAGRRLGRGGGFYDRTFPPAWIPAPRLVGVGYAFQRVPLVPAGPEDRRMDAVVTDREAWRP